MDGDVGLNSSIFEVGLEGAGASLTNTGRSSLSLAGIKFGGTNATGAADARNKSGREFSFEKPLLAPAAAQSVKLKRVH